MGTFWFSAVTPSRALAAVVAGPAAVARAVWASMVRAHDRRRWVSHLKSLDDALLKDIGLHRTEIDSVVYFGREDETRRSR